MSPTAHTHVGNQEHMYGLVINRKLGQWDKAVSGSSQSSGITISCTAGRLAGGSSSDAASAVRLIGVRDDAGVAGVAGVGAFGCSSSFNNRSYSRTTSTSTCRASRTRSTSTGLLPDDAPRTRVSEHPFYLSAPDRHAIPTIERPRVLSSFWSCLTVIESGLCL